MTPSLCFSERGLGSSLEDVVFQVNSCQEVVVNNLLFTKPLDKSW